TIVVQDQRLAAPARVPGRRVAEVEYVRAELAPAVAMRRHRAAARRVVPVHLELEEAAPEQPCEETAIDLAVELAGEGVPGIVDRQIRGIVERQPVMALLPVQPLHPEAGAEQRRIGQGLQQPLVPGVGQDPFGIEPRIRLGRAKGRSVDCLEAAQVQILHGGTPRLLWMARLWAGVSRHLNCAFAGIFASLDGPCSVTYRRGALLLHPGAEHRHGPELLPPAPLPGQML